jgi:hypothetical protein
LRLFGASTVAKYQRTKAELEEKLNNQIKALRASSANYDAGQTWEAERLAGALFQIVYNTGTSQSVLSHLGILDSVPFISTVSLLPPDLPGVKTIWGSPTQFIGLEFGGESPKFFAPMNRAGMDIAQMRRLKHRRWISEIIFDTPNGVRLSRRDVISRMRSSDGGGHIDRQLEPTYADLVNGNLSFSQIVEKQDEHGRVVETRKPIIGAAQSAIRQIAWEVERSLAEVGYGGTLLKPDGAH